MQVNKVQQNSQPSFGYRIKKTQLMQKVFEYNRNLLNEGEYKQVLLFCEAMSNIYRKEPNNELFTCNGTIDNLRGLDGDKNISLNIIVNTPKDDYTMYSNFKLSKSHLTGEKNPYIDAKNNLTKLANDTLIKEGNVSKYLLVEQGNNYIQKLINRWKNATSKVEKNNMRKALIQKLNHLELKMS